MQPIQTNAVQQVLDQLKGFDLYIHLEITNGAYTSHRDKSRLTVANFLRNVVIRYTHGTISGTGPYRVGLKLPNGWVFTEGLTHWEENEPGRLVLAGLDSDGRLNVALQLSPEPF
ncbi:hypothetical protein J31TS4_34150 [Paenibacillus sp. J31TS4]|uniref:YojF family protein n=1 Tax=Paenibacillus sp. J31TS4 TaxID=2807195 RepID=UPI001B074144|nr:YojF family protein [Paenibacillus sp. J31TS4]GIP40135.1 hypothetical protein J31TS4_34150 [Paenibacillus sp. J31TS4]